MGADQQRPQGSEAACPASGVLRTHRQAQQVMEAAWCGVSGVCWGAGLMLGKVGGTPEERAQRRWTLPARLHRPLLLGTLGCWGPSARSVGAEAPRGADVPAPACWAWLNDRPPGVSLQGGPGKPGAPGPKGEQVSVEHGRVGVTSQ